MNEYFWTFIKAFALVTLTAANVRVVSGGHYYVAAFLTGGCLSAVWWFAVHGAALSNKRFAWLVYSVGAGLGTITGMWLGSIF